MYRGRGRGRGNRPQIHENISVGRETVPGWSHQPIYPNTQNYHQTRSAEHELGIASRLGGVHQRQESHFVNQTPAQFDSSHMVQQFMQDPRLTAMYNGSQQSHIPIAMRIGDPNTNGIGRSHQTPIIYQNSAHFASSKVEQYMPDPRLTSRYSSSQQQSHIPVALRIGEPNTIGKGKSLLTSRTEGHFSGNNRDVVAGITRLPDGSTQNRLRMNEQRGGRTLRKLPIAIPVSPVFDRNNQEEFGNLDSFVHNLIDSFDLDQSSSAPSTEQREQPQRQTTELRDQSQPQSNELREKLQLQRTEPREQSQPQSIDPREQFQLQSIQRREQAQRQNIELISEQPELCQDEEQESFPSRFADFQRYFEVCEAVAVAPPSHSHLAKPIASSSSSGDKLIKESLPTARVRPELRGKQPLSNDLENSLKQTLEDIRQRQKITSPSPLAHSSNRNDESHNISEHSSRSNPPRAYDMEHNPFFYPPGPGEIIERNQRLTTGNMEPSNTRCNRSPFDDRQRPLDVPGSPEWHREVRILDDDDNGPDSRNWEPRRSPPGRSRSRSRSYSRSPQRLQRYFRSVSPPSYHRATRSRSRSRSRRSYHRSPHSFDRSPRHFSPRRFTSHPDSPPYRRYSRSRSRSRSRSVISPRSYHRSPHSFDRNLRHLSQSPRLSQRCIRPDSPPPRRRSRSRSRSSRRSYRRSPSFHRSLRHSPDNRFTHSRRSRNSPSPVRSRRSSPIRDRRSSPVRSRRSSPIRSRNRRSSPDYNYPNFLERRVIVQRNSPSPSRLRSPASRNTRHYVNGRRDFKSEQVGSDMIISPYSNASPQFFTRDYIAAAVDSSEFANEPEPPPPGSERYDVPPLMQIPIMRRSPIPSDRGRCPNGSRFQREEYQNYSSYGSSESKRSFY